MSLQNEDLESSLAAQLDQLVAQYLRAEDKGRVINLQSIFQQNPALQEPFNAFLKQHLEMKRRTGEAVTSAFQVKQSPVFRDQAPVRTAELGHILGHCCLLRELGRGGMGIVYQGRHVRLDALRAIKILPREKVSDESVLRFWREAQTAAKIEHPNVVTIHDVGHEEDLHYIIMQYIDGETLFQVWRRHLSKNKGRPFPWESAFKIMHPVLDALSVMHSRGLFHRDIKPSNIMVANAPSANRSRRVVLMDFGLVRDEFETRLTETGAVMGTPAYMAPEQARGDLVDGRADIYGVGASLYFLLAGRPPFEGHSAEVYFKAVSGERPRPLVELRPDLPAPVLELVDRAMAPDLSHRFENAEEMLKKIGAIIKNSPRDSATPEFIQPTPKKPSDSEIDDSSSAAHHDTDTKCGDTNPSPAMFMPAGDASSSGRKVDTPGVSAPLLRSDFANSSSSFLPSFSESKPSASLSLGLKKYGPLIGILSIVLMVVVGFYLLQSDSSGTGSEADSTTAAGSTIDMVFVSAGTVHLGDSEERLRKHAEQMKSINQSPQAIDEFVESCQKEPEKTVQLKGFWIDKYEVTNSQYSRFIKMTRRSPPSHWTGRNPPAGKEDHPVTNVRYEDAAAYASWAGKKLPTLAQWVRAFRGSDDRFYPWGDHWLADRANTSQNRSFEVGTSPISASPEDVTAYGVYNMVGNVSEFVRDRTNYQGVTSSIIKGSNSECLGDLYGSATFFVTMVGEEEIHDMTGFRCVIEKE